MNTAFHALHLAGYRDNSGISCQATKKISDNTRQKYPLVPWKDIAGMRDKLIHDYFGIDLDDVWDTVEKDIPI
ncbi:MAG: DUF86 domain-containing protein [Candidatus Methanoperedenaceae archaeon]|nr:DUF86 domain-containing protein [Candidatus Methanoperedenaceae archaeon]